MSQNLPSMNGGAWLVASSTSFLDCPIGEQDGVFIGIDFGTSTTVVSIVGTNENGDAFEVKPLVVSQPSVHGGVIRDALINTVLSYRDNKLFFGQDAYNVRSRMIEGRNTFSSFKMALGLDLGPEYSATILSEGRIPDLTIERPADATREFFKLLREAINEELNSLGITKKPKYAFTVPAAFQANQRRDLLKSIQDCGIEVDESCLIDEPNAAFLSYIYEVARSSDGSDIINRAKQSNVNILVYDFGAGTCDLSLLEFSISGTKVISRNKAISKFTALGGDDIDRAIAKKILMDQVRDAAGKKAEFTSIDIDERIIPKLMPAAEKLKIAICKMFENHEVNNISYAYSLENTTFETQAIAPFRFRGGDFEIKRPHVSTHEFIDILESFCGDYDPHYPGHHVAAPVHDVLDKACMDYSEVDAVLFIGGSAKNPLVQSAVMDCFESGVQAVIPRDLRMHVSQGAAIHSFGLHGFGFDFIAPITSETVYVVTRGGGLESLIPASSPVPTTVPFVIELLVSEDNQSQVDIPICSGSRERLIGIISIHPEDGIQFKRNDKVLVRGFISKEKLIEVTVTVADQIAKADILSPMSNETPSPAELKMLKEKQRFNQSVLENNGRPNEWVVKDYSQAAAEAGDYELAADLLVALERLNPSYDHSTNIGYYYSMAGRRNKSREWHKTAYQRRKNALTAYNLACGKSDYDKEKEELLREALEFDPEYVLALDMLAHLVAHKNPVEAKALKKKLVTLLKVDFKSGYIDMRGLKTLELTAKEIGEICLANEAKELRLEQERQLESKNSLYLDKHLLQSKMSNKGSLLGE